MNRQEKFLLLYLFFIGNFACAQDTAKVMCYNIENYTPADTSRNTYFRTILADIKPDILVVEEITSQTSVDIFLNNVLKAFDPNYKAGQFIKSREYYYKDSTSNAIFFNSGEFDFISNTPITTDQRDINEFKLLHKASNDTLIIFCVHLNAGLSDSTSRGTEIDSFRTITDQLPQGANYIVLGDFNAYSGSEAAVQKLIDKTNTGYFLDPINQIGDWHNKSEYASIHTQSTRSGSGGLDDRFDLIFISQAVKDPGGIAYVNSSYNSYGNDGQHFNKSINEFPPNSSVSSEIADALYYASDHLPVFALLEFDKTTEIKNNKDEVPQSFELFQNYPNPFNPSTRIIYYLSRSVNIELKLFNIIGQEIKILVNGYKSAGLHEFNFNADGLASGLYLYRMVAGNFSQTKKMVIIR